MLRSIARRLKTERDWSGRELGDAIGIAQQNASRFVAAGSVSGWNDMFVVESLSRAAEPTPPAPPAPNASTLPPKRNRSGTEG